MVSSPICATIIGEMTRARRNAKMAAIDVVRCLGDNGHRALLAGGCVRDMLLGLEPKDYDVATDAVPERVIELFARTRKVGAQFGVVLVRQAGLWIEVATFRSDHAYQDGRHPVGVTFGDPVEDAKRRDFTVNGMFYDPIADEIIDHVGGQDDLRRGLIRTIGSPDKRFGEDHLRLIRAVRFSARFQFPIETETKEAMTRHAASVAGISAERIREELDKILHNRHRAQALRLMADTELLGHLWPNADWSPERIELSIALLERLGKRAGLALSMACLLIHWPREHVNRVCRDLTCGNDLRKRITWLVEHRDALMDPPSLSLADLKLLMHHPCFGDLRALTRIWLEANDLPLAPDSLITERVSAIPPDEVAPPPLLDGDDLIAMGTEPGPIYRDVIDRVYRAQLDGEVTTKASALDLARSLTTKA